MKNKIISITAALLLVCVAACSCGSYGDPGIEAVSKAISGRVDGYKSAESPIKLPGGAECTALTRESAEIVSDFIAVYRSGTAEEAENVESLCKDYLDIVCDPDSIAFIGSYDPASAAKLKSAEVFRIENYVVLCISDASTVKSVKKAANVALYG